MLNFKIIDKNNIFRNNIFKKILKIYEVFCKILASSVFFHRTIIIEIYYLFKN
jgi:hypothetical protein